MAKKIIEDHVAEIKKAMNSKTLVIGTDETMKLLKQGKLAKVFVTSNCSAAVADDVAYYGSMSQTPYEPIKETNDDLGIICKKPYSVAVISILKV